MQSKWIKRNGKVQAVKFTAVFFAVLQFGCTNSFLKSFPNQLLTGSTGVTGGTGASGIDNLVISAVSIATPAGSTAGTAPTTTVFFNTIQSTVPVSNHCNIVTTGASQTTKPCNCQFKWNQVIASTSTNATTGLPNAGTTIPHSVLTAVATVQPSEVTCPAPSIYSTEIPVGTQINISVVAGNNNPDASEFQTPAFAYMTQATSNNGNFSDSQGDLFENIMRYSCYSLFQRGMSLQSATTSLTSPNATSLTGVYASKFCLATIAGGAANQNCPNLAAPTWSAQNYYYDLYVQSSELGHINLSNTSYICPTVIESLGGNGTTGTANKFWPLDSSFALSISGSTTFNVGVVANSIVSVPGDQASNSTTCAPISPNPAATATGIPQNTAPATGAAAPPLIQACLGYAATPNSDGTCPYFTNALGQLQLTYRLRKYVALYPRIFDTDGSPAAQPQAVNTVYVIDRPVKGPSTSNPLQPYTMRGPKPCPFAYYDRTGVTGANPNVFPVTPSNSSYPWYVASNDPTWAGKNVDGIQFPNQDSNASGSQSCSAAIPIVDGANQFTIQTVNINNGTATNNSGSGPSHLFVRPIQPFLAHYEEDTTFQACAPLSNPFLDPPLHFVKDPNSGNVAWCAESYPTQNNNLQWLDPPIPSAPGNPVNNAATGMVSNYTSHTQKNSASASCVATLPTLPTSPNPYTYPTAYNPGSGPMPTPTPAYGLHPGAVTWDSATGSQTCDRTVTSNGTATTPGTQWASFPLLAPASAIENSTYGIETDSSYYCMITYDNNGGKTNVSSPSDGCCSKSSVYVKTGGAAAPAAAHLEPTVPCNIPSY